MKRPGPLTITQAQTKSYTCTWSIYVYIEILGCIYRCISRVANSSRRPSIQVQLSDQDS